ncbi:serine/threonine-protein kinase PAK 6-like [Ruditapes philippinarum]|uniref:serine/threonine-protein kinase PAK 6-like n=1 Tax=Ruditapes philippinarum TaxID=129788 RepID=UPI00295ADB00|nr:serine/threonine-protein kinase PAK 6-like [Ruditapes philippinarum]
MHSDVCIAEFLGEFHQRDAPTPALIFAGKLCSLRTCMDTSEVNAKKTLQDVLAGLQYLHSKGLVHMDLTKDTVTVSEKGEVKMTGCCLPRKPVLPKSEFERVTPGWEYLAPEVLCGQMYVACADMYAFALLTLEVANSRFKVFSDVPRDSIKSFLELSQENIWNQSSKI